MKMKRIQSEKGAALIEAAITVPIILLISVGIFEFGRAYQTWQVLTNAAREGARVAVLPGATPGGATTRVRAYLTSGQLADPASATVVVTTESIDIGGGATAGASRVTVNYPYSFIALQPIARLIRSGSTAGAPLTMTASAVMRNE